MFHILNAYKLFFLFSFISMKVFVRRRDYYDSQRHFAFITKGSYSYIVQSWIFFREVNTPLKLTLKPQRTLQQSDCKNNFSASRNRSLVMNLKLCKLITTYLMSEGGGEGLRPPDFVHALTARPPQIFGPTYNPPLKFSDLATCLNLTTHKHEL